jgi:anti-repressor protein
MDNLSLQLAIQQKGDELLIDARLLHQHLEVTTRFNDWIARRLADALAVEGKDFYSGLSKTQGRPSTEYALTLDLAKHVSMLERTERGKEIRDSFIAAEKELRNRPALPSYPEALRQLATTLEENEQLAQQNAVLTPKATGRTASRTPRRFSAWAWAGSSSSPCCESGTS